MVVVVVVVVVISGQLVFAETNLSSASKVTHWQVLDVAMADLLMATCGAGTWKKWSKNTTFIQIPFK